MNRLSRWLDGVVERLCNWLNDAVSGKHRLAHIGGGLAGVYSGAPLPVDRRLDPAIVETHYNRMENADKRTARQEPLTRTIGTAASGPTAT